MRLEERKGAIECRGAVARCRNDGHSGRQDAAAGPFGIQKQLSMHGKGAIASARPEGLLRSLIAAEVSAASL
jgi:hypothetical protein